MNNNNDAKKRAKANSTNNTKRAKGETNDVQDCKKGKETQQGKIHGLQSLAQSRCRPQLPPLKKCTSTFLRYNFPGYSYIVPCEEGARDKVLKDTEKNVTICELPCPQMNLKSSRSIFVKGKKNVNNQERQCSPQNMNLIQARQSAQQPLQSQQQLQSVLQNNSAGSLSSQVEHNFQLGLNILNKEKERSPDPLNAQQLPDNPHAVKDWRQSINQKIRDDVVQKIIDANFPLKDVSPDQKYKFTNLVTYARKVEDDIYGTANSSVEYHNTLAIKIHEIEKRMREKREKMKEMQLQKIQQVVSGVPSPRLPATSAISQPNIPTVNITHSEEKMAPPNTTMENSNVPRNPSGSQLSATSSMSLNQSPFCLEALDDVMRMINFGCPDIPSFMPQSSSALSTFQSFSSTVSSSNDDLSPFGSQLSATSSMSVNQSPFCLETLDDATLQMTNFGCPDISPFMSEALSTFQSFTSTESSSNDGSI